MTPTTQKERLLKLLNERTIARARELREIGVEAATIARAVVDGDVVRVGRGLYQLPGAEIDTNHTLAEVSKRVPRGTVCMISALAYHGLTDQLPRQVWMAIGVKARAPVETYPSIRVVRFRSPNLELGVEVHVISGVGVPIYSVAKSLADAFRNPRMLDRSVAIECLRTALDERKATPAEIADMAQRSGAWRSMRPYLEAMTSHG